MWVGWWAPALEHASAMAMARPKGEGWDLGSGSAMAKARGEAWVGSAGLEEVGPSAMVMGEKSGKA